MRRFISDLFFILNNSSFKIATVIYCFLFVHKLPNKEKNALRNEMKIMMSTFNTSIGVLFFLSQWKVNNKLMANKTDTFCAIDGCLCLHFRSTQGRNIISEQIV